MLHYINYFFYLAFNWNVRIAWHLIRAEYRGEKKYGIHTTGADELKGLEKKGIDISHATIYMPVHYPLLEELLQHLTLSSHRHFLDIGCGKGRALCVAAHQGFERLTGIELSREMCEATKDNLAITRQQLPSIQFEVINNDAFYFDIPDTVDCIFLFNPFDDVVMSAVAANLADSLERAPRKINILYVNPLYKSYFTAMGFKETFHRKQMEYLEGLVMAN